MSAHLESGHNSWGQRSSEIFFVINDVDSVEVAIQFLQLDAMNKIRRRQATVAACVFETNTSKDKRPQMRRGDSEPATSS